jgi:hypothetical protein
MGIERDNVTLLDIAAAPRAYEVVENSSMTPMYTIEHTQCDGASLRGKGS